MRILFLASRLPFPPDRGDRLRAFHVMRSLSEAGHEIHLASFISSESERRSADSLRSFCKTLLLVEMSPLASWFSCAAALLGKTPLQVAYYKSGRMAGAVGALLEREKFDLIYVHLFRMAQYVRDERPEYALVDLTDVISREIERSLTFRRDLNRLIYAVELQRVRRFEASVASSFKECWVVSEREAEALRELCPPANVRVVPNGVDLEKFRPCEIKPGNIVSFVGHLGVPHNVDAVLHFYDVIFPLVLKEWPECKFQVVGPSAHRSLLPLKGDSRVVMTGFVEDLNASLSSSSVFVAPLRYCAGLQNKVLEAMAAGVPVVATPCVNEGLGAEPGEEILLASDPNAFAEKVVSVLRDASLRNRIAANARKFVERRFSWQHATNRMAAIEAQIGER
ncbi:MAG: glycosyltransferase [Candidatus Eisenbacteria bacterium]|nr:glycosyltransferase [Candidatus Eisenbacteria bacterium]